LCRPDFPNGFVDYEQRDEEPLSRNDRLPKSVLDFDFKASRTEYAVDQVLQPGAVNVVQLLGRNNFDFRHEKRWIEAGVRYRAAHARSHRQPKSQLIEQLRSSIDRLTVD
jgi:hypothetical protein